MVGWALALEQDKGDGWEGDRGGGGTGWLEGGGGGRIRRLADQRGAGWSGECWPRSRTGGMVGRGIEKGGGQGGWRGWGVAGQGGWGDRTAGGTAWSRLVGWAWALEPDRGDGWEGDRKPEG